MKLITYLSFLMPFLVFGQFERGVAVISTEINDNNLSVLPTLERNLLSDEDSINALNKRNAFRFGVEHAVSISPNNQGNWVYLENGDRIWNYVFTAQGAKGFSFQLDHLHIPEGGYIQLSPLNNPRNSVTYSTKVNNPSQQMGTTVVEGDSVLFSVYEPLKNAYELSFEIINVIQVYRELSYFEKIRELQAIDRGLNDSGDCNIDVDCPLGDDWEKEKRGVGMILSGGSALCSGSLVNNTRQDGAPYFLTAEHCLISSPNFWVVRFNWKSALPVCASTENSVDPGPPYTEVNGATLVSSSTESDFGLLLLNNIPAGNAYYAGWNFNDVSASNVHGMHHPNGDVMKICQSAGPVSKRESFGVQVWRVINWSQGVTEVGSSGSPLFAPDHRIIGFLSGGAAACNGLVDNNQYDDYGRFGVAWEYYSDPTKQLAAHLDPRDFPFDKISGYDPSETQLENDLAIVEVLNPSNGSLVCTEPYVQLSFVVENTGINHVHHSITRVQAKGFPYIDLYADHDLQPGQRDTVTLDFVQIDDQTDSIWFDNITVNYDIDHNFSNSRDTVSIMRQTGTPFNLSISLDCNPAETTYEIQDGTATTIASGGPYNVGQSNVNDKYCLAEDCYELILNDSGGDGLSDNSCGTEGGYELSSLWGQVLTMQAPDGDFGTIEQQQFCVGPASAHGHILQPINLYPNPSSGIIKVQGISSEVQVIDLNGKEVFRTWPVNGQINLKGLSKGVYLLKVEGYQPTRIILK